MLQKNVLIDDSHNAVLCDFGLSRIRSDVTSSTLAAGFVNVIGSRNWMAPERLLGSALDTPCDIYSFGMTIYEVRLMFVRLIMYSEAMKFQRYSLTRRR